LRNGDHVEIITAAHAHPNSAWLNYVVSGKARAHIRHFLKSLKSNESAELGERMLNKALLALHTDSSKISDTQWQKLLRDYGAKNKQEILTDIGLGKRLNVMVAHQLMAMGEEHGERHAKHTNKPLGTITIRGSEGMAVQFAQCCRPIPGDPILGFINKDKGLVIHTHDCPSIRKFRVDPEKWLDVEWDPDTKRLFKVNLKLATANKPGMLAKIAAGIAQANSNIDHISMEESDNSAYTNIMFTVQIENRVHLAELMRKLRRIPEVVRINRVKGSGAEQRAQ
jgi:GTP pyrophosphokinase